jgi:hypothetical protein
MRFQRDPKRFQNYQMGLGFNEAYQELPREAYQELQRAPNGSKYKP